MNNLGMKITEKRKAIGMTQVEFAEQMCVTRQTVSRWEAGTVLPDIDKIVDIARILETSCDYLLKDDAVDDNATPLREPGRLLKDLVGKRVKFTFFDGEADVDLFNKVCLVEEMQFSWVKVSCETKKGHIEKVIPISSVNGMEIVKEDA